MVMKEGTVTINPLTGVATGDGCAKEVFDKLLEEYEDDLGTPPPSDPGQSVPKEQLAKIARAVAKVIPHVVANAEVQTDTTGTINTGATATGALGGGPGVPVTGATTGKGSGTVK